MQITSHSRLAPYSSLRVGGPAETLVILEAGDSLADAVTQADGEPVRVLGHGTNVLISDQGLPGRVILNQAGRLEQLAPNRLRVDSGYSWDEFMQRLIKHNLWGLEFTSGIPGGVGAAVTGNIAAYGHKVADALVEVTIWDAAAGERQVWDPAKLQLSYRASALQLPQNARLVVLDATFELSDQPTGPLQYDSALRVAAELGIAPTSLADRRRIILEARRRAGSLLVDGEPGQAGSFFKNPLVDQSLIDHILSFEETDLSRDKLKHQTLLHGEHQARVPAALVLLAAGFRRGQRWGQVRLHPRQVLKVENLGDASAQEIYVVVQEIITTVRQSLNITLEPEVRFLGEF